MSKESIKGKSNVYFAEALNNLGLGDIMSPQFIYHNFDGRNFLRALFDWKKAKDKPGYIEITVPERKIRRVVDKLAHVETSTFSKGEILSLEQFVLHGERVLIEEHSAKSCLDRALSFVEFIQKSGHDVSHFRDEIIEKMNEFIGVREM